MTTDWNASDATILTAIRDALDGDDDAVLATVVDVEGSAYRRPGATMLVRPGADGVGSVTAGCLEDDVQRLGEDVLDAGVPRVETWDLTNDDDVWGLGLGCNGVITILLEPLDSSLEPALDAVERGDTAAICTVVESGDGSHAVGDRAVLTDALAPTRGAWDDAHLDALRDAAATLRESGGADVVALDADGSGDPDDIEPIDAADDIDDTDDTVRVFVEGWAPPPDLVVFGSGHDVTPVVEFASRVGFRVTAVSFRGGVDPAERYPTADRTLVTKPTQATEKLDLDADTYVVVMSHNFVDDRLVLDDLLQTPVPYVALMGPRKRFEAMREDFAEEGRTLTDGERARIYTPAGLDLGSDSPSEIALSIVGEALAVRNGRSGRPLTATTGPIHERVSLGRDESEN